LQSVWRTRLLIVGALAVASMLLTPAPGGALQPQTAVWENISPPVSFDHADFGGDNYGSQTIVVAPSDPSRVYVGTNYQGIWTTTDAGASWSKVNTGANGDILETGRTWTLAVDPTDADVLYTVNGYGHEQGLWKSVDGGVNWRQMLPDEVAAEATSDLCGISVDPADGQHLLVASHGLWDENSGDSGVLESRDGGETWILHHPQGPWGHGHKVFFIDSSTWLLATESNGFWRTTDSGVSWSQVSAVNMDHGGSQLYATAGGILYAGARSTLLRSADGGATWTEVGPPTRFGYHAVIGDGERLYALPAHPGSDPEEGDPPYHVAAEEEGTTWLPMDQHGVVIEDGPISMAFDPVRRIVYSSNWNAGVWKLELGEDG
jgi:hypothetical protein